MVVVVISRQPEYSLAPEAGVEPAHHHTCLLGHFLCHFLCHHEYANEKGNHRPGHDVLVGTDVRQLHHKQSRYRHAGRYQTQQVRFWVGISVRGTQDTLAMRHQTSWATRGSLGHLDLFYGAVSLFETRASNPSVRRSPRSSGIHEGSPSRC